MVRPRRRAGLARTATAAPSAASCRSPVAGGRPPPGRRARPAGPGPVVARGRRAAGPEAPAGGRRHRRRRHRGPPGRGQRPAAGRAGLGRRRGRRGRRGAPGWRSKQVPVAGPPVVARPAGGGVGRGRRAGGRGSGAAAAGRPGGDVPVEVVAPGRGPGRRPLPARRLGRAVEVSAGDVLDAVVLRSYAIGAAHQALGWVGSEGIAVDAAGGPGPDRPLLRHPPGPGHAAGGWSSRPRRPAPVNGSDAVFAAVAAARWLADGLAPTWPTDRHGRAGGSGRPGVGLGGPAATAADAARRPRSPMSTPVGPYSPIVRAGPGWSARASSASAPGPTARPALVEGGPGAQLRQALANLARCWPARAPSLGGRGQDDGVHDRHRRLRRVNEVYVERFGDHRPARSAVAVAGPAHGGGRRGRGVGLPSAPALTPRRPAPDPGRGPGRQGVQRLWPKR